MRSLKNVIITALLALLSATLVSAQGTCPDITGDALDTVSEACSVTGRNQACYGNGLVDLIPRDTVEPSFVAPGDLADVALIDTLTLSPFDATAGHWGVVLLRVQANIPNTLPGQNVTMLLFGDSELINVGTAMEAVYFRSGIGSPDCQQAPDGLLIQTPDGLGMIELLINDVSVSLGSTAYLRVTEDDELLIALLEGAAQVAVDDVQVELDVSEFTTIPLDETFSAMDTPTQPTPIGTDQSFSELPLPLLPRAIDFCPPAPADWVAYRIRTGDTLSSIAVQTNTTTAELQRVNCVEDRDVIVVGTLLWVPSSPAGGAVAPNTAPNAGSNAASSSDATTDDNVSDDDDSSDDDDVGYDDSDDPDDVSDDSNDDD